MVSVKGISEDNQNVFEDLSWAIEADLGQFSLKLIHCNYQSLRQKINEQLQNTSNVPIQLLKLESTDTTLYTTIQNQLESVEQPAALIVTGLESVVDLEQLLRATNQVREEFRKNFHFPIVLWTNDRVLKKLQELAQDFTNWSPSSFRFTIADSDILAQQIQEKADLIFERILEIGSKQFLTNEDILGVNYHEELQAAQQDLSSLEPKLSTELQSHLDFIEGRKDYIIGNLEPALEHYQESLIFWKSQQENHALKTAIILFHIGLIYKKLSEIDNSNSSQYLQDARQVLEQCISIFEQAQRHDLIAKFINSLGEVLINLSAWNDLQQLAIKSIKLHEEYGQATCLAQAYGFLGEFYLEKGKYQDAFDAAQSALKDIQLLSNVEEGLYLLLSAIALSKLGKHEQAIIAHQQASQISTQNQSLIYLRLLKKLRSSYWSNKQFVAAYHTKQERLNLKQEFGLTAFVGAGRLKQFESAQAYGRKFDIDQLIARIATDLNKLTIIYGQSGVGKSSLVEAGLIPSLKKKGRIGKRDLIALNLRVYSNWEQDLANCLADELLEAETTTNKELRLFENISSTSNILKQLEYNSSNYLLTVLIFDQFEEFFFKYKTTVDQKPFFKFLAQCLRTGFVKVVLSLREDYLHLLLRCSRYVKLNAINNNILDKEVLYYIGNFSSEETKSIIEGLTERSKFYLESALIDELVKDLAGELREIRPIELQVVGAQLQTENITTLEQYRQLGEKPKETLVQRYLEEVIADCGLENQQAAELVLYLLTSENNTRPLKTRAELVKELNELAADLPTEIGKLDLVLDIFVESGLVFLLPEIPANRYQLVHDYLVVFIRRQQEQKLIKLRTELQNEINRRKLIEKRFHTFWKCAACISFFVVILLGLFTTLSFQFASRVEKDEIIALANSSEVVSQINKDSLETLLAAIKSGQKLKQANWLFAKVDDETRNRIVTSLQQAIYWVKEKNRLSEEHTDGIFDVSFSPDGGTLASGSFDKTVKLWTVKSPKLLSLIGHSDYVFDVSFSTDNQIVTTASRDKTIKLWSREGKFLETLNEHNRAVWDVDFSPEPGNEIMASASQDGTVNIWQNKLGKWEVIDSLDRHKDGVLQDKLEDGLLDVSFSPNGQVIAIASADHTVKIWEKLEQKWTLLQTLNSHVEGVTDIDFTPDGNTLASASNDQTIIFWEKRDGKWILAKPLKQHEGRVNAVSFSSSGNMMATASNDKTVLLWEKRNGEWKLYQTLAGHNHEVLDVNFSSDEKIIATASQDRLVKLWKKQDGKWKLYQTLAGHNDGVWDISFSSDNKFLASASADQKALLWNLDYVGDLDTLLANGCNWIRDSLNTDSQVAKSEPEIQEFCHKIYEVQEKKLKQGKILAQKGKISEALSIYKEAQKLDPDLKIPFTEEVLKELKNQ